MFIFALNMKKIINLLLLQSLLTACLEKNVTKQMDQIDSLVVREKYDSAYARVLGIDISKLSSPDDSAHYYLLFVQTSVLTDHPDTSVMLDIKDSNGKPWYFFKK